MPGLRIENWYDISLKTNPNAYAKALAKIQPILSRRLTLSTPTHHPTPNASETIAPYPTDSSARAVKLFRNGANQAVRIPKEFELPGTNALMHREGNRLILELMPDRPKKGTVAALAAALREMAVEGPIDAEFPDVDAGLLPLDDIDFGEDSP